MTLFNQKGDLNEFLLSYVAQINAEQPNIYISLEPVKIIYQYPDDVNFIIKGILWTEELEEAIKLHQLTLHQGKGCEAYVHVTLKSSGSTYEGKAYRVPSKDNSEKIDLIVDFNSFKEN